MMPGLELWPLARSLAVDELAVLGRAHAAGHRLAVLEGLELCAATALPLPEWLAEALRATVVAELIKAAPGKVGRHARPVTEARERVSEAVRYYTVMGVREAQEGRKQQREELATSRREAVAAGGSLKHIDAAEKHLAGNPDPGTSWEDAFRVAAELLHGTFCWGTPETIKNSFEKVRKTFESGSPDALRYRLPAEGTLKLARILGEDQAHPLAAPVLPKTGKK